MDNKIRRRFSALCILLLTLLLCSIQIAPAAEFSADIKEGAPGLNATTAYVTGKVYIKGHSERKEYFKTDKPVFIFLPDKGVELLLFKNKKQYGKTKPLVPFKDSGMGLNSIYHVLSYLQKLPTYKRVGKTKIAGYTCYKHTFNDRKNEISGTVYVSPKLGCILKISVNTIGGQETLELSNIKEAKQPASLFRIPRGYKERPHGPPPGRGFRD